MSVPAGTSSGKRLRIKGLGVPDPKNGPGDLYAEIQIVVPGEVDPQSRQLIQELDERNPMNPRGDLQW